MRWRLLGPVRLVDDSCPEAGEADAGIDLGPAKQRCVLAALLLTPRQVVPVSTLIDRVWGEAPPTSRTPIAPYATRLRRVLDPVFGPDTLRYAAGGYLIDCEPDLVDLHRSRRKVFEARAAEEAGDDHSAAELLLDALRDWGDEALTGVPGAWAARVRYTLAREKLDVLARLGRAGLRLGRAEEVAERLAPYAAEHPTVEALIAAQMNALAAAGRPAQALEAFARTRDAIAEELGSEPGFELSDLHTRILRGDGRPGAGQPGRSSGPVARPGAPAQLPADAMAFTGRRAELAELDHALLGRTEPDPVNPGRAHLDRAHLDRAHLDRAHSGGASSGGALPGGALPGGARGGALPDGARPGGAFSGGAFSSGAFSSGAFSGRVSGGGMRVAVITGPPGVGKSALAVHWGHRARHHFPDGQLHLNLRGYDRCDVMSPEEAARNLIVALVPDRPVPAGLDARAGLLRSLLAGRRMLLVLDNARDADHVRPLLPGTDGCAVVVTSRDRLIGLVATPGALPVPLEALDGDDARELLAGRLGAGRLAAEPCTVAGLMDATAGLPLALVTVAARAAMRARQPLAELAAEISASRLDGLRGPDEATDPSSVFSWSYRALSPDAARLFRLFGAFPGPDISAAAAASLIGDAPGHAETAGGAAGTSGDTARSSRPAGAGGSAGEAFGAAAALAELVAASLISEHRPGRYDMHELLRAYAESLLPRAERDPAVRRLLDHHLHTGHAAALCLDPQREPLRLPPVPPGVAPEAIGGEAAALEWFGAEHDNLMALIRMVGEDDGRSGEDDGLHDFGWHDYGWHDYGRHDYGWHDYGRHDYGWHDYGWHDFGSRDSGWQDYGWRLPWVLIDFLDRQGHWDDWIAVEEIAVAAARRRGEVRAEALAQRVLARGYVQLGHYEEAEPHYAEADRLYQAAGDPVGEAHTLFSLSWMREQQDRYDDCLRHTSRALDLYRGAGHRVGEARALNALGWYLGHHGHYDLTLRHCQDALRLQHELGDRYGQAAAWDSIGWAHHHLGDHGKAVAGYRRALELYRAAGDLLNEAEIREHLGDAYAAAGGRDAATRQWRQALALLEKLDHPGAATLRAKLELSR
ncbi:AfsR/SARP family transcriptional regulator [Actinoplanes aureus]|uniref:Winged helix-turn-helix domain-containing protein n=1 Tax=Actinoplanes aureus TaxID=2792083 RepID=A0A931FWB8_9ACTN|nr:BTAD domain-containing putative transcriptional regulator [Actinoplanes aureus]MBG0561180.1 winged helix-turn-helix domain-containing protein [Actinoplanes aureus]